MSASAMPGTLPTRERADKSRLRRTLIDARQRRDRSPQAADALVERVLSLPEIAAARCLAAYVSLPGEPPTTTLLDRLRASGADVLLPVLLPDGDLDWAPYTTQAALVAVGHGLREPAPPHLGLSALHRADVVLVPGLAAGADGMRLGRGGGSYDRALARVSPAAAVVLLLWEEELLDAVPAEPHDRRVDAVVTPARVTRFARPR